MENRSNAATAGLKVLGRASSSNVQKVMWLLAELGIAAERTDIGGRFGGNREPGYLALNPNGVIPTLVDGEVVVWESNTILRYLCNRYGGTLWYPAAPAARALVEQWMDWQLTIAGPAMAALYGARVRTQPPDARAIAALTKIAAGMWVPLDAQLARTSFVAGDEPSLADVALGALAYRWFTMDLQRPDSPTPPALRRWYERLREREAFRLQVMLPLV